MKPRVIGALVIAALLLAAIPAASQITDVCSAYKDSYAVIVGTVTRLEVVKDENGNPWYEIAPFKVTETLKGSPGSEVKVFNRRFARPDEELIADYDGDDACLSVGGTYIVYGRSEGGASGSPAPDVLYANLYDEARWALLANARIETFRQYLSRGTPNQGVFDGIVTYGSGYSAIPLRTAKVRLELGEFSVEQPVDDNGAFRFFDLLPGDYNVSFRYEDQQLKVGYFVHIPTDGCAARSYDVDPTGEIDAYIELPGNMQETTLLRSRDGELTDEGGTSGGARYEELPPGKYSLYVTSVYWYSKEETGYRYIFKNRPLMGVITLKPGQKREPEYKLSPKVRGKATLVTLANRPQQDIQPELVVTFDNGVTSTFSFDEGERLIFEKPGKVRIKVQCFANACESNTVTIDSANPPDRVTLTLHDSDSGEELKPVQ